MTEWWMSKQGGPVVAVKDYTPTTDLNQAVELAQAVLPKRPLTRLKVIIEPDNTAVFLQRINDENDIVFTREPLALALVLAVKVAVEKEEHNAS